MVELADQQHGIRPDAFAQRRAAACRAAGRFEHDGIAVGDIGRFEIELLARIKSSNAGLLDGIRAKKDLTAELEAELKSVLEAFVKTFA